MKNFTAEQERIIRTYLRGEIDLTEAADLYDAEMRRQGLKHKIPVKFTFEGTAYVESSVGVIRPGKLAVMVQAAIARRRQR